MITTAMLLGLAWKSALVAGLTLGLLRLARSRSAGERSMIAHAGIIALLALPAAMLLLPSWTPLPESWSVAAEPATVALPPVATEAMQAGPVVSAAPAASETAGFALPEVGDLAPFLYAIPLALLSGMMLIAVIRLFAMRGRAEVLTEGSWLSALAEAQRRMGFKHGTALLVSEELRSPISWGVLRPTIVLSPVAVEAVGEAEAIIAHELAHVARLDWAKLLGARTVCALFWFNPLVWMLARESHQLREEAADDAVLMADIDGPDYATLLVGAARHDNQGALMAAHGVAPGKGSLKRRITRVLDGSLKRGPASASWILMSLVLLAGITAPLAAFSATADQKATEVSPVPPLAAVPAVAHPSATAVGAARSEGEAAIAAASASHKPLTAEQLVSMRAVGVTPEYVERMREQGGSMDPDDIIAAKATGVDAAYVRAMRGVFPGADMDEIIGASALHIEPGYAAEMKKQFRDLSIDDLTAMRAMGITGDYIRKMRGAGYSVKDADAAIELRATGMMAGPKRQTTIRTDETRVDVGPGGIEARANGRVARIAVPEPPEPPATPEN
ncbi:M56 family metallopeptidase [Sphingopyxis sp.]|uniref:M56 family metallopeptidase n=1 Tax=Sphingopyxis sp. TaxID=1908224 RepID=UPI003D152618